MTNEDNSEDADKTSSSTRKVTNPFGAGVIDGQLFESIDALQSMVAEHDVAMQRTAKLLSDDSLTNLQEALEILDESAEAIGMTQKLGQLFSEDFSTEIQKLAVSVQEIGNLNDAILQNPVVIPNTDVQMIDPELLDLMVTDFANGPIAEPTVQDSFNVESNQDEAISMTAEEWVELGVESDMILVCYECSSAVLRQNSHRYQQREDGTLICPRCSSSGRGVQ